MKHKQGIGVSRGIAIGTAMVMREDNGMDDNEALQVDEQIEQKRLDDAIETFCRETEQLAARLDADGGGEILRGHIQMLRDPYMLAGMRERIVAGKSARAAVVEMCEQFAAVFEAAEEELTRQRAADVRDIRSRLCQILGGGDACALSSLPQDSILVVDELTPSMTARLDREHLCGIIACRGGVTSHSAILARAMHIPAVLGATDALDSVAQGMTLALDGTTGEIQLAPDEGTLAELRARRDRARECEARLEAFRGKPTVTADGTAKELLANIGSDREVSDILKQDAEGVGLFRTEFLFMDQSEAPDEEAQFTAYRAAASALGGRPLIIRTLDVGGDKDIPYLGLEKEENPFLGFRAIRYCLTHPDLFLTQLRAILRASAYGNVRILLPMVTRLEEMTSARGLIERAKEELKARGERFDERIYVGVMIETPAACAIADLLAARADFFSIGTNDLTQYIMVTDRGNEKTAELYSAYHPAVLRAVRHVIVSAHRAGISVGMCGESAADATLTPLLLAWGLDEFSVNAAEVLALRERIERWTVARAEEVAAHAMTLETEGEVRAYLSALEN